MLPVEEVAEQYWMMLEKQSSLGRKTLQDIPVELRKLCPLKWCTDYKYQDGMRLLVGYYKYDHETALKALQLIEVDILRQLEQQGYKGCKQAFKAACIDFYEWQTSYRGI